MSLRASTLPTPKARTWWPASGPGGRSRRWRATRSSRTPTGSSTPRRTPWNTTSGTRRTWSSPSSRAGSLSCKPGAWEGAATGEVTLYPDQAEVLSRRGHDIILVRHETSPEDVSGLHASNGVLTARGGVVSHAAIVARGMGKAAVVGAESVEIDERRGGLHIGGGGGGCCGGGA